jgi:hypothetical protein
MYFFRIGLGACLVLMVAHRGRRLNGGHLIGALKRRCNRGEPPCGDTGGSRRVVRCTGSREGQGPKNFRNVEGGTHRRLPNGEPMAGSMSPAKIDAQGIACGSGAGIQAGIRDAHKTEPDLSSSSMRAATTQPERQTQPYS